jgi:hypothetical protein
VARSRQRPAASWHETLQTPVIRSSRSDVDQWTEHVPMRAARRKRGRGNAYLFSIVLVGVLAVIVASIVVFAGPGGSVAQTVLVTASDSTYVVRETPDRTFAGQRTVQAAAMDDEHSIVYLKFVVPSFASKVTDAHLELQTASVATDTLSAHRVTDTKWHASGLSYRNRPQIGTQLAAAPAPDAVGDWVSFNIDREVTGPGTFSFAVASTSTTSVFAAYARSLVGHGPRLVIAYSSPDTKPGRRYAQAEQGAAGPIGLSPKPSGSASGLPTPSVSASGSLLPTVTPVPGVTPPVVNPGPGGGGGGSLPTGPTICGGYFDTPSGSSYMQGLSIEQGKLGTLKSVRVFNPGAPSDWPGNAGNLNRTVTVSFKYDPSGVLAGNYDSKLRNWFANAPRDRDIYWSYWHEPEDESFSMATYRSAWRHVATLANEAKNPRLHATLILMQWSLMSASGRDWHDYYPGNDVIQVIAWDVYNLANRSGGYTSPHTLLDPIMDVAAETGKPWAIAELGAQKPASDPGSGRAAWLNGIISIMRSSGALWAQYFDANRLNIGRYDWRMLDSPSQQAWRNFCNS